MTAETVIHADAFEYSGQTPVIVLEDIGAAGLNQFCQERILSTPEILTIAVRIAAALDAVHRAGIIHKDVNPSNLIYNPATGQLKLIDFGIAARLDMPLRHLGNPAVLEGTLAYISPEQTGRMNRVVDNRTDLYSFGVTLYELCTGQLPFYSDDPLKLVYDHLAAHPVPPHEVNPAIPPILSAIVMKLLAKNADDRYQSAQGVRADLERCLALHDGGHLQGGLHLRNLSDLSFPLAQADMTERFRLPQKLYGREQELAMLLAAFERVSTVGQPEVLLITGSSGTGKSALVHELYRPITGQRGLLLNGKFDQLQRNVPYYAIRQALDEFVTLLLTEPEATLHYWRERILAAVGNIGQVVLDLVPRLELIIGKQPPVALVGPQETQNRFQLVLQNMLAAIAHPDHPVVLFLDDLQWADAASLNLLNVWLTDPQLRHLLLILAYRDNEIEPGHPLLTLLDDLQQAAIPVTELPVANLSCTHVNALLAETFVCEPEQALPLAEIVTACTDGNAFFTRQLLNAWHEGKLIRFDRQHRQWTWDLEQIRSRDISADVITLMQEKLRRLPAAAQTVLGLAACIGNTFDVKMLSVISEHTSQETLADLNPAIQAQIILPLDAQYQYAAVEPERGHFRFLHDRVQQGAYDAIGAERKAAVHLKIGRLLLANTPEDQREEHLFNLVSHLNQGQEFISDRAERQELANLNRQASHNALGSAAYQTANELFRQAASLLPEHAWETAYALALDIHTGWAEAAFMAREFTEAKRLCDVTLQWARAA